MHAAYAEKQIKPIHFAHMIFQNLLCKTRHDGRTRPLVAKSHSIKCPCFKSLLKCGPPYSDIVRGKRALLHMRFWDDAIVVGPTCVDSMVPLRRAICVTENGYSVAIVSKRG